MVFTLRDARLADMPQLRTIFMRASMFNEGDRILMQEHPEWLELSDAAVGEGRTRVAVEEDETVVGFATYFIAEGIAELEDLFVDPSSMRRGIGEALVLDISDQVRQMNFEVLEVTANPHAMTFYEYVGFEPDRLVETEGYPAMRMRRPTG
ncbi:MAG: GNAT family N-acetyltransferase [Acidobacteria bacterium]|nr:GNAT family N-acetyltransferase [Acidobacteriota bacterium]